MLKGKNKGFLILLAVELALLIVLLPGCFRAEKLEDAFSGGEMGGTAQQAEDHLELYGHRLVLTPGVYQVRVWSHLPEGQNLYVEMNCDHAYFKSLRSNGMAIFPGNDYDDFDVFVLDRVSSAYVQCNLFQADPDVIVGVEVWKTNLGGRMLWFLTLAGSLLLNFMILFRRRILEGQVTVKQQVVFWTLTGGVLLACFPYLTDYVIRGDDGMFHLSRIAYLADALREGGRFPVRVQGTWNMEHGYPVSLFYGDLFLYIPAMLRLIGFSVMTAYKIFIFLVTAATAAISYFCFKKCAKDAYGALFGSMIYLLAPYRLYNVFSRAAMGEFLAMTFLPLVCCGVYLLYTGDVEAKEYKSYKWYVVWGMSALLQSHLISTEMTAFLMAVLGIVFWKRTFRRQTVRQFAEAVGIALLINAWFWLPLFYMMTCDGYHMEGLVSSDVQFSGLTLRNFFYWLPHSNYPKEYGISVWVGAVIMLLIPCCILWRYRHGKKDMICRVLLVLAMAGLVMSTTYFPWNAVMKLPGIGFVAASLQFPWRWLVMVNLFSALLAAFFFPQVFREGGRYAKTAMGVLAVMTVFSAVYHMNYLVFEAEPMFLWNEENMGTGNVSSGEYLLMETELSDLKYHGPLADEGLLWRDYEKTGTNVNVVLENTTEEVRYFEIPLTGYKGYAVVAQDTGRELPCIARERGAHGDLRLEVPAGYEGSVRVSYRGFAVFWAAELASLLGLWTLAGVGFYRYRKRRLGDGGAAVYGG